MTLNLILLTSGVQYFLDPRGQRGSLMPTSKKFFSINSYPKISDDLFYAFIPIFTFIPSFLNFFPDESPPYPARPAPFLTIYPYFYIFTYTFFRKIHRWMPPWLDARGRRTHPHPPSQATAHNRSSGRLRENCVCFCN